MPSVKPTIPAKESFVEWLARKFWRLLGQSDEQIIRRTLVKCERRLQSYGPHYEETLQRYIRDNKNVHRTFFDRFSSKRVIKKIQDLLLEKARLTRQLENLTGKPAHPPLTDEARLREKMIKELAEHNKPLRPLASTSNIRPGVFGKIGRWFRGFLGLGSFLAATFGFEAATWAVDKAKEKITDDADLSSFLPMSNHVRWTQAPFIRFSRERAPYFEPNVVEERISIQNQENGVVALGIDLKNLPEQVITDVDINGKGAGNSDWLCEPFGGYLVCRSISGSDPLRAGKTSTFSLLFHLHELEVQRFLLTKSGTRRLYYLLP
ncbi:hypothetical protein HYW18_00315 [Candidatus Uhrbacteria bacterium]|nr:hypothetical protein [Candidatus Uhrbacteria bacterium]